MKSKPRCKSFNSADTDNSNLNFFSQENISFRKGYGRQRVNNKQIFCKMKIHDFFKKKPGFIQKHAFSKMLHYVWYSAVTFWQPQDTGILKRQCGGGGGGGRGEGTASLLWCLVT